MMKPLKNLSDLGLTDLAIKGFEWSIEGDCDGESEWLTAVGTVTVTIKLAERNAVITVIADVTPSHGFTCRRDVEIAEFDTTEGEDEDDVLATVAAQAKGLDWAEIERHLDHDYREIVHNEAEQALFLHADEESYSRDPYRYYGVSRRDFY